MRIDRSLNFVLPIEREEGTVYVHATPISRDTFKQHFLVMSRTFNAIYTNGLGYTSGPRVAMFLLEEEAQKLEKWDGPAGVANSLIPEMRRLAMFIGPGPDGAWSSIPLQVAINQDLLSEQELDEVENCVAFFTVASAMHRREDVEAVLTGAGRLWSASTSSLNSTEFAASLPTSTATANGGKPVVTL